MLFMTNSITTQVNALLDRDFMIRRCLLKDIVSLRALSRYAIRTLGLRERNMDAVISAIRRYKRAAKGRKEEDLAKAFSGVAVKTRGDMVDIHIPKSKKYVEKINTLNSLIDMEKGEVLRVIQAEQGITLIIDDRNLGKFFGIFSKPDCLSLDKNLAEVNLQFSSGVQNIRGIISLVTSSLSAEGVNLVEIMSSAPELILIIRKPDLLRALQVVNGLQGMG